MKKTKPFRISVTLSPKNADAVRREAAERSITFRALIEACIAERYDPMRAERDTHLILREIKGLRRKVELVDFELKMLIEFLTVGLRNIMAVQRPPTPADKQLGERYYAHLVSSVEKAFAEKKVLVDRLAAELLRFESDDFAELPDAAGDEGGEAGEQDA